MQNELIHASVFYGLMVMALAAVRVWFIQRVSKRLNWPVDSTKVIINALSIYFGVAFGLTIIFLIKQAI